METNQQIIVYKFLSIQVSFAPQNKVFLKDIYTDYVEYCVSYKSIPVEKQVFLKYLQDFINEIKEPSHEISYVENAHELYFLNMELLGPVKINNMALVSFNREIENLEQKAKTQGLTEKEEKALRGYKYARNACLKEKLNSFENNSEKHF